jgi:hypothetical protein
VTNISYSKLMGAGNADWLGVLTGFRGRIRRVGNPASGFWGGRTSYRKELRGGF